MDENGPFFEEIVKLLSGDQSRARQMIRTFNESLKSYKKEEATPLNYNHTIQSQLIHPHILLAECDKSIQPMLKFDLSFAYINSLSDENLQLPFGKRRVLVGDESHEWLHSYLNSNDLAKKKMYLEQ